MRNFEEFKKFAIENGWQDRFNGETFAIYNQNTKQDYVINTKVMAFVEYNESGSILKDNLSITDLRTLIKVFGNRQEVNHV